MTTTPFKATPDPTPVRRRERLAVQFARVRRLSERLVRPLTDEDLRLQSMPDVSPPYWNIGHTSWFFATNLLRRFGRMPPGFDDLDYSLNSYYEVLGPRLPRDRRGEVSSPTNTRVWAYRHAVDEAVGAWISECPERDLDVTEQVLTIGSEHERQHQELFLTEIHHIRWSAPEDRRSAYLPARAVGAAAQPPGELRAFEVQAAKTMLGYQGRGVAEGGFCWDNELPAHPAWVGDYALADRLVTNREWLAFVEDGGYRDPLLWLSNGWEFAQRHRLEAPLYWLREGSTSFHRFSLRGVAALELDAPVCNVSFYEADAFARWFGLQRAAWRGARLPREAEWEHAARLSGYHCADANLLSDEPEGSLLDVEPARPAAAGLQQLQGTAWEWTQSHYEPYPGYRPFEGALTEYNGKFMDNQRVLRGGSYATPRPQARVAYRNFWPGATRFQASSVRLCVDR